MDTFHPARIDDIEDNSKLRRGIPGEHVGCERVEGVVGDFELSGSQGGGESV